MSKKLVLVILIVSLVMANHRYEDTPSQSLNDPETSANQVYKVDNVNTSLRYETIQEAINAPETLDGHDLILDLDVFYEHVTVNKSVDLYGCVYIGYPDVMTTVNGNGSGTVISVEADNVTIHSIKIINGTTGIIVEESDNTVLWWLRIYDNAESGIYLYNSRNCTVRSSKITNNKMLGIYLEYSSNNTISGNTLAETNDGIGLGLFSSNNTITGNRITNNVNGVIFSQSAYNDLTANYISDNDDAGVGFDHSFNNSINANNITENGYGIKLFTYSEDNRFYHNNFIGNAQQVYIYEFSEPPIANSWDDSSKGNYWSDYKERYTDAEEIDNSGIWDTPYVIDENNVDYYPIVPEFPSLLILLPFMIVSVLVITIRHKYRGKSILNHTHLSTSRSIFEPLP